MTEDICPTIAEMHTIIIHNAVKFGIAYQTDLSRFRYTQHGKRSNLIRLAARDEFLAQLSGDTRCLYVWVIQRKPGTHYILPLYRGSPQIRLKKHGEFQYADVTTDDEIAEIIDHLTRDRDQDTVDWMRYRGQSFS